MFRLLRFSSEMAEHAMHMVNDSVTAYVEEKSDLAKR